MFNGHIMIKRYCFALNVRCSKQMYVRLILSLNVGCENKIYLLVPQKNSLKNPIQICNENHSPNFKFLQRSDNSVCWRMSLPQFPVALPPNHEPRLWV